MENPQPEAMICGKILLYTAECEISFICELCYQELTSLPELMGHVFHEHVKGMPQNKIRELCRIQAEQEDDVNIAERENDVDAEMMIQEMFDNQVKKEPQFENEEAVEELVEVSIHEENEIVEERLEEYQEDVQMDHGIINNELREYHEEYRIEEEDEKLVDETHTNDEIEPIEYSEQEHLEEEKPEEQINEHEPKEDQCQKDTNVTTTIKIKKLKNTQFEFLDIQGNEKQIDTKSNSKFLKPPKKEPCGVECNVCFERFKNKRVLMEHKKEHGDRPYVCNRCGAGFRDKANMQTHYLRHLGIKPHSCELCEKTFTTTTELKIHMRSHTGEHPYKCMECDKAYTTASQLAAHRRRHSNLRPYLCNICGKTFFDRKQFTDHAQRHSTERPHKCPDCNASFTVRKGLVQHLKLHSGVKKYSCEYCGKQFAQQAGVYSHMKTHKNESKISKQQSSI